MYHEINGEGVGVQKDYPTMKRIPNMRIAPKLVMNVNMRTEDNHKNEED